MNYNSVLVVSIFMLADDATSAADIMQDPVKQ